MKNGETVLSDIEETTPPKFDEPVETQIEDLRKRIVEVPGHNEGDIPLALHNEVDPMIATELGNTATLQEFLDTLKKHEKGTAAPPLGMRSEEIQFTVDIMLEAFYREVLQRGKPLPDEDPIQRINYLLAGLKLIVTPELFAHLRVLVLEEYERGNSALMLEPLDQELIKTLNASATLSEFNAALRSHLSPLRAGFIINALLYERELANQMKNDGDKRKREQIILALLRSNAPLPREVDHIQLAALLEMSLVSSSYGGH